MKTLTSFLFFAALGLSVNSLSAATNTWNGAGVGANTGSVWDAAANYTGGSLTFSSTNDLDFSTITIAGPTTLTASAGTYAVKDILFGTTASTIASATAETLVINGNGTTGATTLSLAGNMTLPSPNSSLVTFGSDLVINLSNSAHTVGFRANSNVTTTSNVVPAVLFNARITGGGASATLLSSYTAYGTYQGAPGIILTNDNNTFDAQIGRISGRLAYTSIGNIGATASSLGAPSLASSTILMSNGAGFDYVGSGNQTSNRGLDFTGTVAIENLASTASILTFNGTMTNSATSGTTILRLNATAGNSLVFDTVLADGAGAVTALIFQGQNSTAYYTATGAVVANNKADFTGTVFLKGLNTYTGTTTLDSSGVVNVTTFANVNTASGLGKGSAAGSAADIVFGGGTLQHTAANVASTDRLFTIKTTATLDSSAASPTHTLSFTGAGAIAFSTTSAHILTLTGTNTGDNTFASVYGANASGTSLNSLVKSGAGKWILTGANTYTGTTKINEGILSVSSIGSVASPAASALGAPTTTANGTIAIGSTTLDATLLYTGSAQTTDRVINLAGTTGGATLDQSGTGLLKFTSAFTATGAGSKTLTLQGSTAGTGEIAAAIVDNNSINKTGLTKTGTGTWTLSGANTYTGTTTINQGILNAGVANVGSTSGAFGKTGNITFTGGTLQYSAASAASDYSARIKNSTGAISVDTNGQSVTFASALDNSNTGGLTKRGAGTLTLSAVNTYTGATTVGEGMLVFANNYTLAGANRITLAAAGTAGTDYATMRTTAGTLTFGGTLGINITATLTGNESFNLFTTGGGVFAGDFGTTTGNVSITGSYSASLANNGSGVWTGSASGLDFTFATSGVNAGVLMVASSIPEPSTYAVMAGVMALSCTVLRRRRVNRR